MMQSPMSVEETVEVINGLKIKINRYKWYIKVAYALSKCGLTMPYGTMGACNIISYLSFSEGIFWIP